jgi:hypothetical protein
MMSPARRRRDRLPVYFRRLREAARRLIVILVAK